MTRPSPKAGAAISKLYRWASLALQHALFARALKKRKHAARVPLPLIALMYTGSTWQLKLKIKLRYETDSERRLRALRPAPSTLVLSLLRLRRAPVSACNMTTFKRGRLVSNNDPEGIWMKWCAAIYTASAFPPSIVCHASEHR